MWPAPWGGGHESEEQSPHLGKPLVGDSGWTEGEPHSLWEEITATSVEDRVRPVCRLLIPALSTQPERVSSDADKDCVPKRGVRRADPGRGLRLALRRHPEGMGVREELYKRDACGGSLNHQRSRVAVLSDARREEPTCSLCPCACPCLSRH